MPTICPTITAIDLEVYRQQLHTAESLANRIHIDLMDGDFAPTVSVGPSDIWWGSDTIADLHVMFRRPEEILPKLLIKQLHMVIIHAEAEVDHVKFAQELHSHNIKAGIALLQPTEVSSMRSYIDSFDHVLVFSGRLGYHGGTADLANLEKVKLIKRQNPGIEIGWDGGINPENIKTLIAGGVDVLNVGGFIQGAEDPAAACQQLLQA